MRVLLVMGMFALAVAGCGGDEDGSGGGSGGEGASAQAKQLPAALTFQVSGGLRLRMDKITIQPDGSAQIKTLRGEKPVKLTNSELSTVADQLDASGLEDVPENSRSPRPIPDAFGYRFIYKGRQVDSDQESNPGDLQALTATLTGLVDRYGPE
jgi:hypothetical protein